MASLMVPVLFAPSAIAEEGKSTPASEQETAAARKEIEAAYNRMMAAYAREDLKGVFGEHTANYVSIDENERRTSKAEDEKDMAKFFEFVESIRVWTVIQSFALKGNTATVLVRTGITFFVPASKNQKKAVCKGTARLEDIWVKRDGKWLLVQGKTLASYLAANGKVLP